MRVLKGLFPRVELQTPGWWPACHLHPRVWGNGNTNQPAGARGHMYLREQQSSPQLLLTSTSWVDLGLTLSHSSSVLPSVRNHITRIWMWWWSYWQPGLGHQAEINPFWALHLLAAWTAHLISSNLIFLICTIGTMIPAYQFCHRDWMR